MGQSDYQLFTETYSLAYNGSDDYEQALTLNRDTKWSVQALYVYSVAADADAKFTLLRKATASTANERDPAHEDSDGVLQAQFYYANLGSTKRIEFDNFSDLSTVPIRLHCAAGITTHTIYVTVVYKHTIA